jgi:hypothetical protein
METIPLIKLKKRKIIDEEESSSPNILEQINDDQLIYILDYDGIEKDKPNLCTYQKLSKTYELWVDFGPRNLGDIVDAFMAGATRITIRRDLCLQLDIPSIREITENKIYLNINLENQKTHISEDMFYHNIDGMVNFNNREKIRSDFRYSDFLKKFSTKNKIYSHESDPLNVSYWKNYSVEGLLVDIKKIREFKNHAL